MPTNDDLPPLPSNTHHAAIFTTIDGTQIDCTDHRRSTPTTQAHHQHHHPPSILKRGFLVIDQRKVVLAACAIIDITDQYPQGPDTRHPRLLAPRANTRGGSGSIQAAAAAGPGPRCIHSVASACKPHPPGRLCRRQHALTCHLLNAPTGFDNPDVMAAVAEIAHNPSVRCVLHFAQTPSDQHTQAAAKHAGNPAVAAFYTAMATVMERKLQQHTSST